MKKINKKDIMIVMDDYEKEANKMRKERARLKALPEKLLLKINWETLTSVKNDFSEYDTQWKKYDGVYRIFHRSFKMYNLSKDSLTMWEKFFSIFGIKSFLSKTEWEIKNDRKVGEGEVFFSKDFYLENNSVSEQRESNIQREKNEIDYHNDRVKHVVKNLKKIGADEALIVQIKMLKNKIFTLNKNGDKKAWAQEGAIMAGTFSISKKIIESSLKMLTEWSNREGYLWQKEGFVEIDDALVMDSLGVLNLRYNRSESIIPLLQSHFESLES